MLTTIWKDNQGVKSLVVASAASVLLMLSPASQADSGFYLGGSVGTAAIEINDTVGPMPLSFDESDFAWKAFGGFTVDLPVINLGVEAGYFNLGGPSGELLNSQVEIETDGLSAFGVLGLDLGPLGVFGKYGIASWDSTLTIDGMSDAADGSDPAYGVGIKLGVGSLDLRAEYEILDIEDAEDISMVSVGLVWTF